MALEFDIPFVCFIFIAILSFVYFTKRKIKLIENKYYEVILISSLIVSLINTVVHIICSIYEFELIVANYSKIFTLLNRIGTSLIFLTCGSLLAYTLFISYKKVRDNAKIINYLLMFLTTSFFITTFFLNFKLIKIKYVTSGEGTLVLVTAILVIIELLLALGVVLINIKRIDRRHYAVLAIIVMTVLLSLITIAFPEFNIYDLILALLCYIMFFTIENPDLKMIESLNIAKSEAEKANLAKSDFLASMSHEIRTPLNAVVGFSHAILEDENLSKESRDYATDIVKASNTLLEIVGGVLDVSKIESNKMDIVEVLYNPREEIQDLVKIVKARLGEKPVTFNYKVAEDLPYQLYGDRANMKKVVTNLLTNAVKYTAKGQIFFNVRCINKEDICHVIISVQDTGMGIKEEYISKLFTKFERLEVEKDTTAEGTGLGLAITKRLVELMHGKINVKSQYGVGSIFMAQIPQRIAMMSKPLTDTQMLSTLEIKKKRAAEEANINGQRVLIVDDNALNIKVAKIALKNFNLEIDTVASGEECLKKIRTSPKYDLILMDIMMPGMSGEETFENLKKQIGFNVPVIALTADAVSGAKEKYLAMGFTSYISKPFSPEEIKVELIKIFK